MILKLRNQVYTSVCLLPRKFFWYSILRVGSMFTSKNLNSPDDEWIESHPKRSSFVAWIINYLYELNLTLNARNRNQKESGGEQDSCRTRNQDFVAPATCHIPIEVVSVRVREHPHWERTPFGVVSWTEQREMQQAQWGRLREWRNSREAEGRPKSAAELRERWSGKIFKSQSE